MAYRKPNAFTQKVFNPIAMRFGISGTETLEVRRRRSGGTQRVPVIPIDHDGARYIVSARGESEWVKNLRAAGGDAELGKHGAVHRVHVSEVPVDDRTAILATYQKVAGKAVSSHFSALPANRDHPVFRIEQDGA